MIPPDLLQELKSCAKQILKLSPKKEKQQHNHKQQAVLLQSVDGNFDFELFIRQNIDLPNDFSVGIIWKSPESSITLARYNGDHGRHRNKLSGEQVGPYHIHQYHVDYISAGLNTDAYAEKTDRYTTMLQALYAVCIDYNIENYADHFAGLPTTGGLFDISENHD